MQSKILLFSALICLMFISPAYPWPIPDTGQTKCYDNENEIPCPKPGEPFYGQDGNYNINPPSYTKLDEKGNDLPDDAESWVMVRDNVTGLIWEVKNNKDDVIDYSNPHDADNEYSWYDSNPETNGGYAGTPRDYTDTQDFISALNDSSFGGGSDWRLPDLYELSSIFDLSTFKPSIHSLIFPNAMSAFYWSSTSYASNTGDAWGVYSHYGNDYYNDKDSSYYVRAVRGRQSRLFGHLIINENNTVTDLSTGLMWYQETQINHSWSEALSICENFFFANYSDWRLPTKEELRSIVSFQHFDPAVNVIAFPDTMSAFYWSSTPDAGSTGRAWGVPFRNGNGFYTAKDSSDYVRAVRGGQSILFGHLIILAPNQASSWETGKTMQIRWDAKDITGNVRISLSRQGGKAGTFEDIEETPNDGEYDWLVEGSSSVNCMLKIEPVNAPEKFTQQGMFMITNCKDFDNTDFVPNNLISTSHSINDCNCDHTIDIAWLDDPFWINCEQKIDGYSVKWDNLPDTLPEKQISTQNLSHTSPPLEDSNEHYVHIRAVNEKGDWSDKAVHLGPFCIESPLVHNFFLKSSSHSISNCNSDQSIDISWDNCERNYDGYSVKWDHLPDTLPDNQITLQNLSSTSSPPLKDGTNHYVHIRFLDDQGNWSDEAAHLGPFCIKMPMQKVNNWPVPDNGKTICYDNEKEITCPKPGEPFYGQDGNYNINPPSYTKLDEKGKELPDDASTWIMVRDNVTGLIWEVKDAKDNIQDYNNPHDADNKYTWYDSNPEINDENEDIEGDNNTQNFINSINETSFGGFTDWYLPDIYELASITDLSIILPAINTEVFPNTMIDTDKFLYWCSTRSLPISFDYGCDIPIDLSANFVRAVHGEQSQLLFHFVINDDETVTDLFKGLMWTQKTLGEDKWSEALSVCENLLYADYSDWRLPIREELRSIVYLNKKPSINEFVFPGTKSDYYWSSSTDAELTDKAWVISFINSKDYAGSKDRYFYFRAVRGGQNQLPDHVIILSPDQATNWDTGENMPIRWDTRAIPGNVIISLSRQGGKPGTFDIIAETPNDGKFDWTIEGTGSVNCMLKIEPCNARDKFTQQGLFIITDFVPQNLISNSHKVKNCQYDQTIDIEWTPPEVWDRKIGGYALLWDTSPNTVPENQMTTTDLMDTSPALEKGDSHYVHIRAVDDQGNWSNIAAHFGPFCTGTEIPIPKGLQTSNNTHPIRLEWYYMGDDLKYTIYRSESENGFFSQRDPLEVIGTEFIDTDVVEGRQYWYKVKAVNILGEEGFFSDPVSATIEPVEGGSFSLISHQPYQMQLSGLSATYQIHLEAKGGYSENVILSVNNLPTSFLTATFDRKNISLPGIAILTVNIFDNVPENQYTFNVSAQGVNRHAEIPLFLDVKKQSYGDSVISAYVSHAAVHLHQSFNIYGNLAPRGINAPVLVYVQHESEHNPVILKTHTDQNKSYKTSYTPEKTGQYRIYARWDSDGTLNSSESDIQSVTVYRGESNLSCETPNTDVSSDNRVQITGKLSQPKLGDSHIILRICKPDGNIEWKKNIIFTETDGSYAYSLELDQEGIWEITSCWEGNDQYLGSASYPLRLYPGLKTGKALIVAGGGIANNTLWETIQYQTTEFYKFLLKRHFTQDMIYYLSPDINHQDDAIVINDDTPEVSDIENYIKSLYQDVVHPEVNSERPFLLYLSDHGGKQMFQVNRMEYLKARDLDDWLDNLQMHTNCSVFVILEACYSGSFVDSLMPSSEQKRVIVTSTGEKDASYSDGNGRSSFSQFLLNELSATNNNLYDSFVSATSKMKNHTLFKNQHPQIEDGKNGEIAKTSYIGGTFLIADILPEIVDHTPMQIISAGTHELFMDIFDIEGIKDAWVSIMPPYYKIPSSTNDFETPIIDLPKLKLTDKGNGRYSVAYDNFIYNGDYYVTFHCEDIGGNVVSKEVLLNVTDGYLPGDMDKNGKVNLSDAIISMQSTAGMTVSVSENAKILCNGASGACEVIEILQIMAGMNNNR